MVVLLLHFAARLCPEIWMRTGTAKQRRFIAVHAIQLPYTLRMNILAYHALTECNTVSQVSGHGKTSTWKTFQKHTILLNKLGRGVLFEATEENAEAFICRVYTPHSNDTAIDEVRYRLLQKDTKDRAKLPPSKDCLVQQIKRAHYQSQIWYLANISVLAQPSPIESGWFKDPASGQLRPRMEVDDPLPQEFTDVVYCNCKNCATTRCTCRSKRLTCTGACSCSDDICQNPFTTVDDDESE